MISREYSWAVGKCPFNRSTERKEGWTDIDVITPHGFVTGYAQGDETHTHHTCLDFFYGGRVHTRSFDKRYSVRGIATKAMQFAEETVREEGK